MQVAHMNDMNRTNRALAARPTAVVSLPPEIDATRVMMREGFEQGPPPPALVRVALRTIRSIVAPAPTPLATCVASPPAPWTRPVRRLLDAVQALAGTRIALDELTPMTPNAVAEAVPHGPLRVQLLRLSIMAALCDGRPHRDVAARLRALATALRVRDPAVKDVELLARGRDLRLKVRLLSRFWAIPHLQRRIRERGVGELVRAVLSAMRIYRDDALAARYRALEALPADSLGRRFLAYLADSGFPLPGERGATTDIIISHDLTHVLAGYDTTPMGEMQVMSFTAGHSRINPFAQLLFVICQFHLGVRLSPNKGVGAQTGYLDPVRILEALRRGARMTIDPGGEWDYWTVMHESVHVLRRRYEIEPAEPLERPRTDSAPVPAWAA